MRQNLAAGVEASAPSPGRPTQPGHRLCLAAGVALAGGVCSLSSCARDGDVVYGEHP